MHHAANYISGMAEDQVIIPTLNRPVLAPAGDELGYSLQERYPANSKHLELKCEWNPIQHTYKFKYKMCRKYLPLAVRLYAHMQML